MPRLRSSNSGVIVSVSDETAKLLDSEWTPADGSAASEAPDKSWKVGDLKQYAVDNDIDLGGATKKDEILEVITAAGNPDEADDESDESESEES